MTANEESIGVSDNAVRRLEAMIAPTVEAMGFDLVRVRWAGAKGRATLQIMAERPDGTMNVEDCAELSRAISALFDIEDPIPGEYELEVSSPGIDRPLTRAKDFERYAGFDAKVEMRHPMDDGRKKFSGRLMGLEGDEAVLSLPPKGKEPAQEYRLPLSDIAEAKLVLTDALIEASLKEQKH